jgi:tRNA(fMet)-specific endonuclease VapC
MGLTHLLDTNICVAIIRRRAPEVLAGLQQMVPGSVGVSIITVAELEFGAAKSLHPQRNRDALEQFLLPLEILDYDSAAAQHYGDLRLQLENAGTPIGPLDTLIAAQARSLNATLVTNNLDEFRRVPGLEVVDWIGRH